MARAQELLQENDKIQRSCDHSFEKLMRSDPNYTGRNDKVEVHRVVDHLHCTKCNVDKPFDAFPFVLCWVCTGKMIHQVEQADAIDGPVYVCQLCGHEYVAQ